MNHAATATATIPMPALGGRNREIWVGLFVLAGIFAVAFTLFTLTDPSTFRGRTRLLAHVPNAAGIRRGDPVQMKGVNIGRTKAFTLRDGGVDITLEIDKGYSVPADSKVVLKGTGLLGEMVAEVLPGTSSASAKGGTVLPGSVSAGPFGMAQDVAGEATKTLERLQALLSERTVGNVQQSSEDLARTLAQVRELTSSLRRSAKGVESAVGGPELQRSLQRLDSLTARLDGMAGTLEQTAGSAQEVLSRLEHGQGSLGRLSRDDSLYLNANQAVANLAKAAQEITALTADIRREPKKYLKISVF
jgi:phospholipid/cholesterol/gamma-HCH transport system substrate-binding protein